MDVYYGQILFILGIIVPLLVVCFLRWACGSRQAQRTSGGGSPQEAPTPASNYQEVGLPRTLSYFDPPNGEPPPSYESIQQIPDSQTLTYIDEYGNAKHVKWDGGATIPTRTALGHYNPSFCIEVESTEGESVEGNADESEQHLAGDDASLQRPLPQGSEPPPAEGDIGQSGQNLTGDDPQGPLTLGSEPPPVEADSSGSEQYLARVDTDLGGPLTQEPGQTPVGWDTHRSQQNHVESNVDIHTRVSLETNRDLPEDQVNEDAVQRCLAEQTVNVDRLVCDMSTSHSLGPDTHQQNESTTEESSDVVFAGDSARISAESQRSNLQSNKVT